MPMWMLQAQVARKEATGEEKFGKHAEKTVKAALTLEGVTRLIRNIVPRKQFVQPKRATDGFLMQIVSQLLMKLLYHLHIEGTTVQLSDNKRFLNLRGVVFPSDREIPVAINIQLLHLPWHGAEDEFEWSWVLGTCYVDDKKIE